MFISGMSINVYQQHVYQCLSAACLSMFISSMSINVSPHSRSAVVAMSSTATATLTV
jgi:hypothetical protein